MSSDLSIRDRPRLLEHEEKLAEKDGSSRRAAPSSSRFDYDPAVLGERIDRSIDYAERFYLARDQNVFTSLFNTFVSTTATVAHGATNLHAQVISDHFKIGLNRFEPCPASSHIDTGDSGTRH